MGGEKLGPASNKITAEPDAIWESLAATSPSHGAEVKNRLWEAIHRSRVRSAMNR